MYVVRMYFCPVHILYIVHSFFEPQTFAGRSGQCTSLRTNKNTKSCAKMMDIRCFIVWSQHKWCLPLQLHPASSWGELSELLIMLIPGNSGALPCWFSGAWRFDGGKKGCLLSQKDAAAASHFDVFRTTEQLVFLGQRFRELHLRPKLCVFLTAKNQNNLMELQPAIGALGADVPPLWS